MHMPGDGDEMHLVDPELVIRSLAAAVPPDRRQHIVIIGSLAAGYHCFRDRHLAVRTKDVDCLLEPRRTAPEAAVDITNALFDADWTFKPWDDFRLGTAETALEKLAVVRLYPPGINDWFIELLTTARPGSPHRDPERITTNHGDLQLCGFPNLDLAAFRAAEVDGIRVAQPAMLALVNLIGHAEASAATMSKPIAGRVSMLRSSKDLGRVLALAYLVEVADATGLAGVDAWPAIWREALLERYPESMAQIAASCGNGLLRLRDQAAQIADAQHTAVNGLLSGFTPKPTIPEFAAMIPVVLAAVARLQRLVAKSHG
jgi:hypothetical protein